MWLNCRLNRSPKSKTVPSYRTHRRMSSEIDTADAPREYRHRVLYESLKDIYWKSIDLEVKEAGILLIIIGWLFTAQRAQEFIASSMAVRILFTIVLLTFTVFHAFYILLLLQRSTNTAKQLGELAYTPPEYHKPIQLPQWLAHLFCVMHTVTSLAIIAIVWLLPRLVTPT